MRESEHPCDDVLFLSTVGNVLQLLVKHTSTSMITSMMVLFINVFINGNLSELNLPYEGANTIP